jgi:hypothetical protein
MSANLYPLAAAQLLDGSLDWTTASIKALFLSEGFSFDAADTYRDQLNESMVIAESNGLTNASVTSNGVYTGDPFIWPQLVDNRVVNQIALFNDTGDDAYSLMIAHWDAECLLGIPITLAGEDYFFYPVSPPGGFFQITEGDLIGPISTYTLAAGYALGEIVGSTIYLIPCPIFTGRILTVRDRVCIPANELESCCKPTIRSSQCG